MIKTVVIIAIAVITTLLRFIVRFIARVAIIAKSYKKYHYNYTAIAV
jgi:hypothetical protein